MLTAVWTVLGILKIAGLVLLGIVGFLLVLFLLVLLVPIRYRLQADFYGLLKGQAGISWFCHCLSAGIQYEEKLVLWIRVLGIRVFRLEKHLGKAEETETKNEEEQKTAREDKRQEEKPATRENPVENLASSTIKTEEKEILADKKTENRTKDSDVTWSEKEKRTFRRKKKRRKKKGKKIRGFSFLLIYDKLKKKLLHLWKRFLELKEKKERLIAFINDPVNRRTYHLLKRQLKRLGRHLLPRKISGQVCFGFEDPAKTGQVLTYISPFYAWYAKGLEVKPVFGESVMEGEIKLRGRIRIGTVIVLAVRMLFDKNFRALMKKLMKA